MSPFGRNPSKTRRKHRSPSVKMESVEEQIVVWVCQEEKIVCGLTKHTTCIDVVEALLEEHQETHGEKSMLLGDPGEYCILEKWKAYERVLPPVTKMLKLCKAWGSEQPNVHFVLVKSNTSLPIPPWRISEAKVTQNAERQREHSPAHYIKMLPVDKQKRIVKKTFRKLAKIRHDVPHERDSMEKLMHIILSQDHTIQQQVTRIKELDAEIHTYEASLHLEREDSYGQHYLQNAYLLTTSNDTETEAQKLQPQKEHHVSLVSPSDEILCLEEDLKYHRLLIENLTAEIDKEMQNICGESTGDETCVDKDFKEELDSPSLETLKYDLEKSMTSGLKIHSHLSCLQEKLSHSDSLLQQKVDEYERLAEELSSLHVTHSLENKQCLPSDKLSKPVGLKKNRGGQCYLTCSKTNLDVNDTDSDTGISSTHSQDSETTTRDVILLSN